MSSELDEGSGSASRALVTTWTLRAIGILIVLTPIAWSLDIPSRLGHPLFREQFLVVMLGLALAAAFLRTDVFRRQRPYIASDISRVRSLLIIDWLLAGVAFAACFYIAIDFPRFQTEFALETMEMLVIGLVVLVLLFEAVRRQVGWLLFWIAAIFLIYAMLAHLVPAPLTGRSMPLISLPVYLTFDANAVLGVPMAVATTIVVVFIFLGQLLFKSGGGAFFTDLAMAAMGHRRGGAAKIAVGASALFGSISGSAVSNVATTGVVTIPMMAESGFKKEDAGAIESVASTGGQFMPPIMGAAAFLMAEFLEIEYAEVVVAALTPALLYYLAIFLQVHLVAARDDIRVVNADLPVARTVLTTGWQTILPFAVFIYLLFAGSVEVDKAALYTIATLIAAAAIQKYGGGRLDLPTVLRATWEAGLAAVELLIIVAIAGIVIGVLNATGGGFALTLSLVQLGAGSAFLLLFIGGIVCIVLGMGMPTSGVYVLLSALVAPAFIEVGVKPLAAHMFILYFGMLSMITPPIALAAFAAATISGADAMRTGLVAMRYGWVAYVIPFVFVLSPELLLFGKPLAITLHITTVTIATILLTIAAVGYAFTRLSWLPRLLIAASGLAALLPYDLDQLALYANVLGVMIGALVLAANAATARQGASQ